MTVNWFLMLNTSFPLNSLTEFSLTFFSCRKFVCCCCCVVNIQTKLPFKMLKVTGEEDIICGSRENNKTKKNSTIHVYMLHLSLSKRVHLSKVTRCFLAKNITICVNQKRFTCSYLNRS